MNDPDKLTEAVNRSGFPLQIGLLNKIQKAEGALGWKVVCSEHAWRNDLDHMQGFIDLVLEDRYRTSVLVVECKRVLESSWIFLVGSSDYDQRRHAKLWITRMCAGNPKYIDWYDANLEPFSTESEFCIVPGQDPKSRPMLERVASEVVSATEALATEEYRLMSGEIHSLRMYASVIVTTATLQICSFAPEEVSLIDGKVGESEFTEVPYVRFRKQLSVRSPNKKSLAANVLGAVAKAKEHTVFVVNANAFEQFLREWNVSSDSLRPLV